MIGLVGRLGTAPFVNDLMVVGGCPGGEWQRLSLPGAASPRRPLGFVVGVLWGWPGGLAGCSAEGVFGVAKGSGVCPTRWDPDDCLGVGSAEASVVDPAVRPGLHTRCAGLPTSLRTLAQPAEPVAVACLSTHPPPLPLRY